MVREVFSKEEVRVGLGRKLSAEELMLMNCGVGEASQVHSSQAPEEFCIPQPCREGGDTLLAFTGGHWWLRIHPYPATQPSFGPTDPTRPSLGVV